MNKIIDSHLFYLGTIFNIINYQYPFHLKIKIRKKIINQYYYFYYY